MPKPFTKISWSLTRPLNQRSILRLLRLWPSLGRWLERHQEYRKVQNRTGACYKLSFVTLIGHAVRPSGCLALLPKLFSPGARTCPADAKQLATPHQLLGVPLQP